MKVRKYILLIFLIISVILNVIQYQKYNAVLSGKNTEIEKLKARLVEPSKHLIEIKTQDCIDKTTYGKLEISKCIVDSEKEWNEEISKHLSESKKFLSNEQYKLLIKSQKEWENYRKIQKNLIYSTIYNKHLTGYINITIADEAAIEITKQREKFLSLLNSYMK